MTGHHVDRLIRWYPRTWRDRYGEEFAELLGAELDEQPRNWQRDIDVRLHGLRARLSAAGLGRVPVRDPAAVESMHLVAILAFGAAVLSLWSQVLAAFLTIPITKPSELLLVVVPALTMLGLVPLVIARGVRLARTAIRTAKRGGLKSIAIPLVTVGVGTQAGLAAFVAAMAVQPSQPAAAIEAPRVAAMSISTYWVHPSRLTQLAPAELIWMVICPVSLALICSGIVRLRRRLGADQPAAGVPSMLRITALLPTLAAAIWWVIGSHHEALLDLRAGTLDVVLVATMAISLLLAAATSRPSPSFA